MSIGGLRGKILPVMPEQMADTLAPAVVDEIRENTKDLAKASDLVEIKEILLKLVNGQAENTRQLLELTASHKRLENQVDCIQEDVSSLKQDMKEVKADVAVLKQDSRDMKQDVAALKTDVAALKQDMVGVKHNLVQLNTGLEGLARSMAYAMENEAYRALPGFLRQFGIDITERFIRTEIAGEEINFLAQGTREGREVLVVGEAALRMTKKIGRRIYQLARKVRAARQLYPDAEIVEVLVTHYAAPDSVARAREKGILVVQTFEW